MRRSYMVLCESRIRRRWFVKLVTGENEIKPVFEGIITEIDFDVSTNPTITCFKTSLCTRFASLLKDTKFKDCFTSMQIKQIAR